MPANKKKIRKEWIVFFVCLMLLLLIWQKLQQTADRPQSFEREIFERAASQQDELINTMLAYLESGNIDRIENSEKHEYLRDKLKKCQGISVARAQTVDFCDNLIPKVNSSRLVFCKSIVTVTIIGVCIMLILAFLNTKYMFSWQRTIVCLLLCITIATALQRSAYWGALSAIEYRVRYSFFGGTVAKYEKTKLSYFEKYYPKALTTECNPDP